MKKLCKTYNKEEMLLYKREWYRNNKDKATAYRRRSYKIHKIKRDAEHREWVAKNPEAARAIQKKAGVKYRSGIFGRLNSSLSAHVSRSLKGKKAGRRWESVVGYTVLELKEHLEKQFIDGMNWDNYGK